MTTLSPETHKIASSMDNFSGWLRARLRQFDEGVDLVAIEMAKDHLRLQFKTLWEAVQSCFPHAEGFCAQDVWERFNEMMKQKKLEDFE
jgi:hypothetical protein